MTYVYTCADGFEKPELKEATDKVLQNSTELSSNALAILTCLGELLPEEAKALNATLAGAGHGRRLLGWQMGEAEELESIASTFAEANRQLLAAEELPDELAGKRELLSRTLMGIDKAATEAKRQLDEATMEDTMSGGHPEHRVLTTGLIGTFDEIQDGRNQVPPGDFPKWMPATQRRLLQLPSLQKPNKVVAPDGSGDFKTITEAIAAVPKTFEGRFVIYVKAGVYKDYVTVPKDMANIFMYGDRPTKTVVTGDKSCTCRFEGYQDTLYVHANRQFFHNCEVLGTVDFIFGNSAALFQNCLMTVRKPGDSQSNMVTA
ncbi:unnamed protein product [Miscanthus lutarioriparius]|uniref:Pectinesterase n=1 Tax=Miscanthus lutarioriparius TaxID=422564 RepID=A0A811RY73_9POAL|nr:unnamed protein product [Miscanthus lutarioriparius]